MMAAVEIESEKFWPQYKVHKFFRVGVKTRVGRVSGNKFLGLTDRHIQPLIGELNI